MLEGDFRQILPVVLNGGKEDIINASITRSKLWKFFTVYTLTINMRLSTINDSLNEKNKLAKFSMWLLSVGNGTIREKKK